MFTLKVSFGVNGRVRKWIRFCFSKDLHRKEFIWRYKSFVFGGSDKGDGVSGKEGRFLWERRKLVVVTVEFRWEDWVV